MLIHRKFQKQSKGSVASMLYLSQKAKKRQGELLLKNQKLLGQAFGLLGKRHRSPAPCWSAGVGFPALLRSQLPAPSHCKRQRMVVQELGHSVIHTGNLDVPGPALEE